MRPGDLGGGTEGNGSQASRLNGEEGTGVGDVRDMRCLGKF
jgi:hypothetical protein